MSYLDEIVLRKKEELKKNSRSRLTKVLQENPFTIIAEIKRGSPSKGRLAKIDQPETLAKEYLEGGAKAISVLTDSDFFASIEDLHRVAKVLPETPLIRKDFIIAPIQIAEAAAAGASTVLLIVKVLRERTREMIELAEQLGLDALVEVHNEEEIKIAVDAGATIIGVNNRNLASFTVDLSHSESLAGIIPDNILKVSESGISSREDIQRLKNCGFQAALIGESIVTAEHPKHKIEELLA